MSKWCSAMRLGLACFAAAAVMCACSEEKKTSDSGAVYQTVTTVNHNCPYTKKPVNTSVTTNYKGKSIGFCCAGCQGKFNAASDADKDKMVADCTK